MSETSEKSPIGAPQRNGDSPGAPLRVGLLGYGLAGSVFHAPLIAATDGLLLDTVSTSSPERQAQARAEHPQVRTVPTAEAVLDRAAELDLIVVASPNKTHVPLATAALEAGLPVVVDKPLAATAAEADKLAALAADRGWRRTTTSAPSANSSRRAPSATSSASSPASSAGARPPRVAGANPATPPRSADSSTTSAATSSTRR